MDDAGDPDFECCICKGDLYTNDLRQHHRDPCSLTLRSSIDKDPSHGHSVVYYCHVDCFAKLVGQNPFDFVDGEP